MEVSFLTPYSDHNIAVGAVIQSEVDVTGEHEFIPMPLEPEPIDEILKRGPQWLCEQLPDAFPVFYDRRIAEVAILEMYEMHQRGGMTVGAMHSLVEALQGVWRDKAEYGYEIAGQLRPKWL